MKRSAFVNLLHIRNAKHILHTFIHIKREREREHQHKAHLSKQFMRLTNISNHVIHEEWNAILLDAVCNLRFVINKIVIKQPQGASNASNAYNSPNIQTIFTISTKFIQLYHTLFAFPFGNLLRTFIYGSTLNLHNLKIFLEFFQMEFEMLTNGERKKCSRK